MNCPADIAVVIPCFNHANVLRRTLEGLSRQTIKPFEVVVVDDGSVDDPGLVVDAFKERLPIRLVRFEVNQGRQAARNEGARQTTATFLIFLDADVELVPDALEAMRGAFERPATEGVISNEVRNLPSEMSRRRGLARHDTRGRCLVGGASLDMTPGEGNARLAFVYSNFYWGMKKFPSQAFNVEELKKRNYIHTSSLIRRDAFPGFDESIKKFQDWDLWLTMAAEGSRGVWIDRYLYRITPHRDGLSHWLPSFMHRIPWERFGWMPAEIRRYREAERMIREKHGIQKNEWWMQSTEA